MPLAICPRERDGPPKSHRLLGGGGRCECAYALRAILAPFQERVILVGRCRLTGGSTFKINSAPWSKGFVLMMMGIAPFEDFVMRDRGSLRSPSPKK